MMKEIVDERDDLLKANQILQALIGNRDKEVDRLRAALVEIRDHWANQYDHPRKENEMYRGPYGIGVTDGHRACRIIAEKALMPSVVGSVPGHD